jgi:hypothetical protein
VKSIKLLNQVFSSRRVFQYALILVWLALNLGNLQFGLADNGDWIRLSAWFASTPVGFDGFQIDHAAPNYLARYFTYWLPLWHLDLASQGLILSSVLLFWLPGILLNQLFFSPIVLFLPWLSLVPRLLVLALLLGIFRWIEENTHRKTIFYLTLALPLVLITSSLDYIAYFNTFYQETAAFIGILLLLWGGYALREQFTLSRFCFFMLALFFLTLARVSLIYWPFLAITFIWPIVKRAENPPYFFVALLFSAAMVWLGLKITSNTSMREINSINAIYTGILPFSVDPQQHLSDLRLQGSEVCIDNIDYYADSRTWCMAQFQPQLTHKTGMQMLIAEPAILLRQFMYVASEMQQLHLSGFDYLPFNLGNYAPGLEHPTWYAWLNIWSIFKSAWFPRRWALLISLVVFTVVFMRSFRRVPRHATLSRLGLMLLAGLLIDMLLVINGDGKYELTKHLYLSNLMFDLDLLLAINLLILNFEDRRCVWNA